MLPSIIASGVLLAFANIAWHFAQHYAFQKKVMSSTVEIRRARDEAEAANRAKSDFLATMSHEIRTPLNAIVALTNHLLEEELEAEQRETLSIVAKSSDHLLQVINDILDLSKLEARKVELELRTISIRKKVDIVLSMLAAPAIDKGVILRSVIDQNVPDRLVGDPARLRQILLNLVSNAVKFTSRGEVIVSVSSSNHAPIDPNKVMLVITVSDTGTGMSEDAVKNLFSKFWQADSSVSRRYGGTGLGLAITRRLITQMDGTIEVTSTLGVGSEFTARIPLGRVIQPASVEAHSPAEPLITNEADLTGQTILLAEDNLTNREIAKKILTRRGAKVDVARDGVEAVTAVSSNFYDIVLMDVQMPNMDGLEAARAIRKLNKPFCQIPIVALTANAFDDDREQCLQAGMDDFCPKPYRTRELASAILRAIGERKLRRQDAEAA